MATGERVERLGHLAAFALDGVKVDFDEDVKSAFLGSFREGSVGSDDCFAGHWVAETHHEMLADGEADRLVGVVEGEGEDACVG